MFGHGTKFPRKKEQAIAALLSQRTIEGAAHVAGIGAKTLRRWLKDPELQEEYRKARHEIVHQTIMCFQQNSPAAGTIILKLAADPKEPSGIRFKAAKFVVDTSINVTVIEDIEERLSNLELDAKKRGNRK